MNHLQTEKPLCLMPDQRAILLSRHFVWRDLSTDELLALSQTIQERFYNAEEVVVREGDSAENLYYIIKGSVLVTTKQNEKSVILSTLGPEEMFGELGLLTSDGRRSATVTTTSNTSLLVITRDIFEQFLTQKPDVRKALESIRHRMEVEAFIKKATPFHYLGQDLIRSISESLTSRTLKAGECLMTEGEEGRSAYLIRSGQLEVEVSSPEGPRVVDVRCTGALVGEVALINTTRRNATLRACKTTHVLELSREKLLQAMREDKVLQDDMFELVRYRTIPKRDPNISINQRLTDDNETITVLIKDKQKYFQLSPQGWFIWQQIDGYTTVRELSSAYVEKFKVFRPDFVISLLTKLSDAGFLLKDTLRSDIRKERTPKGPFAYVVHKLKCWGMHVGQSET